MNFLGDIARHVSGNDRSLMQSFRHGAIASVRPMSIVSQIRLSGGFSRAGARCHVAHRFLRGISFLLGGPTVVEQRDLSSLDTRWMRGSISTRVERNTRITFLPRTEYLASRGHDARHRSRF